MSFPREIVRNDRGQAFYMVLATHKHRALAFATRRPTKDGESEIDVQWSLRDAEQDRRTANGDRYGRGW